MNAMNLLEIIGETPEKYLQDAEERGRSRHHLVRWTMLAASCAIIGMAGILFWRQQIPNSVNERENRSEQLLEEKSDAETAEEIFARWREENGIGEEVKLFREEMVYDVAEGSEESVQTESKEFSAKSEKERWVFHISGNLERYCEDKDQKSLLDSLRKAMAEFYGVTEEQCVLILE